jgi:uncharacterized membrane protein
MTVDAPKLQLPFRRRLKPHRSLNKRQFGVLMVIFGLISSAITVPFFLLGAWPVIGFLGLDVLLLYLAFRANFRSARAYEEISLDMHELRLEKVSSRGQRRQWLFNPRWVALEKQSDEDFGLLRLWLRSSGTSIEMGRFLAPTERENLARALQNALQLARRGPEFDPPPSSS